ncbi:MAG: hypothetical protein ACRERE_29410 [Candidatus Entotheonellia bacterium]
MSTQANVEQYIRDAQQIIARLEVLPPALEGISRVMPMLLLCLAPNQLARLKASLIASQKALEEMQILLLARERHQREG